MQKSNSAQKMDRSRESLISYKEKITRLVGTFFYSGDQNQLFPPKLSYSRKFQIQQIVLINTDA